jgi:hypothetical protein
MIKPTTGDLSYAPSVIPGVFFYTAVPDILEIKLLPKQPYPEFYFEIIIIPHDRPDDGQMRKQREEDQEEYDETKIHDTGTGIIAKRFVQHFLTINYIHHKKEYGEKREDYQPAGLSFFVKNGHDQITPFRLDASVTRIPHPGKSSF